MTSKEMKQILGFMHECEKLKLVMRHSWLSDGRQEDVAQHTWRMALMAITIAPYLEYKVDIAKTLKLVITHDLVEIHYQDNPAHLKQPRDRQAQEHKAIQKLTKKLPNTVAKEFINLFKEYDTAETLEAKFAKTLDKTEVLLQHNEADIKRLHLDEIPLYFYYGKEFSEHDKFLKAFRAAVEAESLKHLQKHKIDKKLYEKYIK